MTSPIVAKWKRKLKKKWPDARRKTRWKWQVTQWWNLEYKKSWFSPVQDEMTRWRSYQHSPMKSLNALRETAYFLLTTREECKNIIQTGSTRCHFCVCKNRSSMTTMTTTSYLMCSMTSSSSTSYLMCSMTTSSSTSSFPSLMSSMSCKSKKPRKVRQKK